MRRLFFILIMFLVIGYVFYGRPLHQQWLTDKRAKQVAESARDTQNDKLTEVSQKQTIPQIIRSKNTKEYLTPEQVLTRYAEALIRHEMMLHGYLYSLTTRFMLSNRPVITAQMENEALAIGRCLPGRTYTEGDYAVLRFDIERRECAPYFFVYEEGRWRLDLTMMHKALRFNQNNQWHFDVLYNVQNGDYGFAFMDVYLDENGYPFYYKP